MIQKNLGETMQEQSAALIQQDLPDGFTQRRKVIGIWIFLRIYRQANPQIIDEIRTDFGRIRKTTTIPCRSPTAVVYNGL